ncbi:alpha/beta hydrolase [Brucepastera parasyntrophica]|uniref:alpha/beta hydrolase n=1 Tax=Brucepastera parasyntrophica TaxID=2880008 RepID=UPI00210A048C|nr:alpha/beta fold hydrolase [Brucepastera parasyntrophica]ULQ60461.1 alpha/beta hydrolase [Brucepastera parasyntrophica]
MTIAIIIAVCLVVLISALLVGVTVASKRFYRISMAPRNVPPGKSVDPRKEKRVVVQQDTTETDADTQWFDEHSSDNWYVSSGDGLKLHAYSISSPANKNWVIVFHGYSGNARKMAVFCRNFYERGFNVLAPDARGYAGSEGDRISMGWYERFDVILWINEIIRKYPEAGIVLFGVSMGGATIMMASGEKLPSNVKVIVEDCGYTSLWDLFSHLVKTAHHLPAFPIMDFTNHLAKKTWAFP